MLRKNLISVSVAIIILYLSLTGTDSFSRLKIPVIPYFDKIVHAVMYFALTFSLFFENRKIIGTHKSYAILATIPFVYGVLIELLQIVFTSDRQGEIFDILSNLSGIIIAVIVWMIFKKFTINSSR